MDANVSEPKNKFMNRLWQRLEKASEERSSSETQSMKEMINLGLQRYLALPREGRDCDPLQWWYVHGKASFPLLFLAAKKVLITPGTSVPSERVFSTAGDTISQMRNRLSPANTSMLITLNRNSRKDK